MLLFFRIMHHSHSQTLFLEKVTFGGKCAKDWTCDLRPQGRAGAEAGGVPGVWCPEAQQASAWLCVPPVHSAQTQTEPCEPRSGRPSSMGNRSDE